MNSLNQKLVKTVADFLAPGKRTKFLNSVNLLNECLKVGEWVPHASRKVESGFYQGLSKCNFKRDYNSKNEKGQALALNLSFTIQYGHLFQGDLDLAIAVIYQYFDNHPDYTAPGKEKPSFKVPEEVLRAWVTLCSEKHDSVLFLNHTRPKAVKTTIGLSSKVTKTLKETGLDIDLSTVKEAIRYRLVQAENKQGKPLYKANGEPLMVYEAYVEFSEGCKFGQTRFLNPGCCEACGKPIPSRMFVPIEAKDKLSGHQIGMWIGTDCAKNIFGVKDIGIEKRWL